MFDLFSCIALWIAGAIIVAGFTQWTKSFVKIKSPYKWIYSIISVAASLAAAYAGGGTTILWNFLGTLAVSQLGYEAILQKFIFKKTEEK